MTTFQDPYSYAEGRYEADSELWKEFFQVLDKLYGQESQIFRNLKAFRMAGTALKWSKTMYVLRPIIDVKGDYAWRNVEEYEQFRNRHLMPFKDEITRALVELTKYQDWKRAYGTLLGKEITTPRGRGILREVSPYGALVEVNGEQKIYDFEECEPF